MSIIEDIGGQVRASAEDLPVDLVTRALDHLQKAGERLSWVRQESANTMGVPELAAATEHAESAGYALRLAQEQLAQYLAAIGLGQDGSRPPLPPPPAGDKPRPGTDPLPPPSARPPVATPGGPGVVRWWSVRVGELTGRTDEADPGADAGATDPAELLHRVAVGVRAGDQGRVHRELRGVDASVGLGLAAYAPPLLRGLAEDVLGHPPGARDLARLRGYLDGPLRELLPGLPKPILDTVLTRLCRMPPPRDEGPPPSPADSAVAAGVLTGLLLERLGRDPKSVLPKDDAADKDTGNAAGGATKGAAGGSGG